MEKGTLNFNGTDVKVANILSAEECQKLAYKIRAGGEKTDFFDEAERIHWQAVGNPTVSTANAKFGKALQCSGGNYIQSKENILLGGRDFTVSCWLRYINANSYQNVLTFGNKFSIASNKYEWANGAYDAGLVVHNPGNSYQVVANISHTNTKSTADNLSGTLFHFEMSYKNGTCYFFVNGALRTSKSYTIAQSTGKITLGGATCSISDFRLLDGVCLHTAAFTPPTTKSTLTDNTVSLLQF